MQRSCRKCSNARSRPARPISAGGFEIAGELDDRLRQRLRLARRDQHTGDAVLAPARPVRRSRPRSPAARAPSPPARPCRSPRPSTERRRRRVPSIARWIGATCPRKRTASSTSSSFASARSAGSSGPRPAMSSFSAGNSPARLRKRAHQDDVALDRDEAPDAQQAGLTAAVRPRQPVRLDPVVDDLEARPRRSLRPPRGNAQARGRSRCACGRGLRSHDRRAQSRGSRGTR